MLYFKMTGDKCEGISADTDTVYRNDKDRDMWLCRSDKEVREGGLVKCQEIAKAATEFSGDLHIATDSGPGCWPRFDVIRAPKVGDLVSYAFNGDSYPDGKIAKISDSLKVVTTDTGSRYYRRRTSGAWIKDGTWSMTQGHTYKQNPEF
jgi:hypothetical protein